MTDGGPTDSAALAELDPLALVRGVSEPTPLEPAPDLDLEREILLKREDLGPNGSFKWRGALCACAALRVQGETTVATASTGNHGAATAWAAARLGLEAHVVVPVDASETKCQIIASHGARIHRAGPPLEEAIEFGERLTRELDAAWFEDGASEAQLQGTGTIGSELIASGTDPAVVITPLACGALAGGLARVLTEMRPRPWIIGVQSTAFPRFGTVVEGRPDPGPSSQTTFADGLADSRIVEPAFSACRDHVDQVLYVDDEALRRSMRELHQKLGLVVEGAAAAPLAGIREAADRIPRGRTVLIVSGRNIDPALADEILAGG